MPVGFSFWEDDIFENTLNSLDISSSLIPIPVSITENFILKESTSEFYIYESLLFKLKGASSILMAILIYP